MSCFKLVGSIHIFFYVKVVLVSYHNKSKRVMIFCCQKYGLKKIRRLGFSFQAQFFFLFWEWFHNVRQLPGVKRDFFYQEQGSGVWALKEVKKKAYHIFWFMWGSKKECDIKRQFAYLWIFFREIWWLLCLQNHYFFVFLFCYLNDDKKTISLYDSSWKMLTIWDHLSKSTFYHIRTQWSIPKSWQSQFFFFFGPLLCWNFSQPSFFLLFSNTPST